MSHDSPSPAARRSGLALWAWVLWGVLILVVSVIVFRSPDRRTVTPNYREAAVAWWHAEDLYDETSISGFLYLPPSAILYSPFTFPPKPVGEALWRVVIGLLLAWSVWRLARLIGAEDWPRVFLVISVPVVLASIGSMANGQMNIPIAALFTHAAVDLAQRKWSRAVAAMTLAIAFKPIALPMLMLAAALHPRQVAWRAAVALLVLLLVPFVVQPHLLRFSPDYVLRQYDMGLRTMLRSGHHGGAFTPADFSPVLEGLGLPLSSEAQLVIRLIAAPLMLLLAWAAQRRWGAAWGAVFLLALTGIYLTLFNPRAENLEYILPASAIAAFFALALLLRPRPLEAIGLGCVLVGLAFANDLCNLVRLVVESEGLKRNHTVRPALTAMVLVYLAYLVIARRPPAEKADEETTPKAG